MVLSFSRIDTFLQCQRLYYLKYIQGLEVETEAMDFGKKVHQLLAGEEVITEPHVVARVKTLQRRLDKIGAEIVAYEVPFSEEIANNIVIEGVYDALGYIDDEPVVFEFKSGHKFNELQPKIYSIISQKPVIVITADGVYHFDVLDNLEEKENIIAEIVGVATALEGKGHDEKQYQISSGEHCKYCPGVASCPLRRKFHMHDSIESLISEYFYLQALEEEIKKHILMQLQDNEEIKVGKVVAKKKLTSYKKLKAKIDKEELYEKYGLNVFKIDTKILQKVEPELFEELTRESLKIEEDKKGELL